jgi:hypothetical protein
MNGTLMLVCALTVPIDDFDDMTPLPAWLRSDPARTRWALQAVLALADAEPEASDAAVTAGRKTITARRRKPCD